MKEARNFSGLGLNVATERAASPSAATATVPRAGARRTRRSPALANAMPARQTITAEAITAPGVDRARIANTTIRQPNPAPKRSKKYRRLTRCESVLRAEETHSPAKKKGVVTAR